MSFPRYPSYKDSGIDWPNTIPKGWERKQLKHLVDEARPITYGIVQAGPDDPEGIPYVRPTDMTDENGIVDPEAILHTSKTIAESYSRSAIHEGDLVCSIGPSFGKVMVTPRWLDGGNLTQGTARIAVRPSVHPRFIFWTLRASVSTQQWDKSVGGATFRSLNLGPLAETWISLPPGMEQLAIGNFLDCETAKIDALVTEQQRLTDLLKEKRQAVISHAVTKGLNPDAPMKDSGVKWLGEVPEHWNICILKRAFVSIDYGISNALDSEGAVAILRMGNIENGQVVINDLKYTDSVDPNLLLNPGDLLYNRTNSLDLVGKVGMFRGDDSIPVSFASYLVRLRVVKESLPEFFAYLLNTDGVLGLARANAFVAIGQCNLNPTRYGQIDAAIPPKWEQEQIVHFLDSEVGAFETLISEAQRSIDLLQERRIALISAAVTGQIDVRSFAESIPA